MSITTRCRIKHALLQAKCHLNTTVSSAYNNFFWTLEMLKFQYILQFYRYHSMQNKFDTVLKETLATYQCSMSSGYLSSICDCQIITMGVAQIKPCCFCTEYVKTCNLCLCNICRATGMEETPKAALDIQCLRQGGRAALISTTNKFLHWEVMAAHGL